MKTIFPNKKILTLHTPSEMQEKGFKYLSFKERKDIVFFGRFDEGCPNNDAVVYFLKEIFPLIKKKIPDISFHVLGSKANVFHGIDKNVYTKEGIQDITEELSKYKVFVCPLRFGAGVKKKVIDAFMSKTPVVTTNVGIEGIEVRPEKDILVANRSQEFAGKVIELYQNESKWDRLSCNSYKKALRLYTKAVVEKQMKGLYRIVDSE